MKGKNRIGWEEVKKLKEEGVIKRKKLRKMEGMNRIGWEEVKELEEERVKK